MPSRDRSHAVSHARLPRGGTSSPRRATAHVDVTPRSLDVTPLWCHDWCHGPQPVRGRPAAPAGDGRRRTATRTRRPWPSGLSDALEAATRVVLLDALSAATGEITRDLAPGSVDLRLRGREVEFVVDQAHAEGDEDERPAVPLDLDDTSTSRTTLRLPDALKARVDEAAAADGLSVNSWLVRAVATALQPRQRRSASAGAAHGRHLRRLGALAPLHGPASSPGPPHLQTSRAPRGRTPTPGRTAYACPPTPPPAPSTSPSTCRPAPSRSSPATGRTPS